MLKILLSIGQNGTTIPQQHPNKIAISMANVKTIKRARKNIL